MAPQSSVRRSERRATPSTLGYERAVRTRYTRWGGEGGEGERGRGGEDGMNADDDDLSAAVQQVDAASDAK